ncbi:uncharacterized protein LOC125680995 [Ostrea edulis]|uniref:uncharacterized protein LOC125680995 n=1 Tax=Ostrea edulis TaxID=37623 RepID=UPI002096079B|nr:uncharacterized protein LOC125680995 [Ostrea edulis]
MMTRYILLFMLIAVVQGVSYPWRGWRAHPTYLSPMIPRPHNNQVISRIGGGSPLCSLCQQTQGPCGCQRFCAGGCGFGGGFGPSISPTYPWGSGFPVFRPYAGFPYTFGNSLYVNRGGIIPPSAYRMFPIQHHGGYKSLGYGGDLEYDD